MIGGEVDSWCGGEALDPAVAVTQGVWIEGSIKYSAIHFNNGDFFVRAKPLDLAAHAVEARKREAVENEAVVLVDGRNDAQAVVGAVWGDNRAPAIHIADAIALLEELQGGGEVEGDFESTAIVVGEVERKLVDLIVVAVVGRYGDALIAESSSHGFEGACGVLVEVVDVFQCGNTETHAIGDKSAIGSETEESRVDWVDLQARFVFIQPLRSSD